MSDMYTVYPPIINGTALTHATDTEFDLGLSQMEIESLGGTEPIDYAEAFREPKISVTTGQLKTVLDSGSLNVTLDNGLHATGANTVAQYQQHADGAGPLGNGNHVLITAPKAWCGIRSITATQDDNTPALVELECYLLENGGINPDVISGSGNLTGSLALADKWILSDVYVNDVKLTGVKSVTYSSNFNYVPNRTNGQRFASKGTAIGKKREFTLGVENLADAVAIGLGMTKAAGAIDVYFQHVSDTGIPTAKTGASNDKHIKISFSASKRIHNQMRTPRAGFVQEQLQFRNTGNVTVDTTTHIPST